MSIAAARRFAELERTVAVLSARVAVLEGTVADSRAFCEARQSAEAAMGLGRRAGPFTTLRGHFASSLVSGGFENLHFKAH